MSHPNLIATLFYRPTLERMQHVPGVQEAALISSPPLSGIDMNTSFSVVGQPKDQPILLGLGFLR